MGERNCPPKRPQSPSPPPERKSLDSFLLTLLQLQTEMKLSERIFTMEPRFEQHSRTSAPSQAPPDDQISVLAYSDGKLLHYLEVDVSLTTEPQDQAIKPSNKAFGLPNKGLRATKRDKRLTNSRGNSTKWSRQ